MQGVARVAISLPEDLLEAVEVARKRRGESRSVFFRRAAEQLIAAQREQAWDEDYIAAYRAMPEEVDAGLLAAAFAALASEPWDERVS